MTPDELRAARHRLGLSIEGLAALGAEAGVCIAESGRTVRRWEAGERDIPGAVSLLLTMALHFAVVRKALGLAPWEDDEREGPQAPEFPAIAPQRPPIDPVPAFTLWPYGCRDSAACAHRRACINLDCRHISKDITARIDALTPNYPVFDPVFGMKPNKEK